MAAEQGLSEAKVSLGVMLFKGIGVERDVVQSVRWTTEAAQQGNSLGQYNLGVLYRYGEAIPKDLVRALMWFDLAAIEGEEGAKASALDVAKFLTTEQREESKELCLDWIRSNYPDRNEDAPPRGIASRTISALGGLVFFLPVIALIGYLWHAFSH